MEFELAEENGDEDQIKPAPERHDYLEEMFSRSERRKLEKAFMNPDLYSRKKQTLHFSFSNTLLVILIILIFVYWLIMWYFTFNTKFLFFVSMFCSFIFAPFYHAAAGQWMDFVFSILEYLLFYPLIQIFVIYFNGLITFFFKFFIGFVEKIIGPIKYILYAAETTHQIKQKGFKIFRDLKKLQHFRIPFWWHLIIFIFVVASYATLFLYPITRKNGYFIYQTVIMAILMLFPLLAFVTIVFVTFSACFYYFPRVAFSCRSKVAALQSENEEEKKEENCFHRILFKFIVSPEFEEIQNFAVNITQHFSFAALVAFILLLVCLAYDIYKLTQHFTGYYLTSIIIRFLFVPYCSLFHMITSVKGLKTKEDKKEKDSDSSSSGKRKKFKKKKEEKKTSNNKILKSTSTFFFIFLIAYVVSIPIITLHRSNAKLKGLEYIKSTEVINNNAKVFEPFCSMKYLSSNPLQLSGLAISSFYLDKDQDTFNNIIKYFYGDHWETNIQVEKVNLTKSLMISKFFFIHEQETILSIRGVETPSDFGLITEFGVFQYVTGFFKSILPLFQYIDALWLWKLNDFFITFGNYFYYSRPLVSVYLDPLVDYLNNLPEGKTLLVGHNTGGILAKLAGMKTGNLAVSFAALDSFTPFLQSLGINESVSPYITNIVSQSMSLTVPDVGRGLDYVIPKPKFLSSSSIYHIACLLAEGCNQGGQLEGFCNASIGYDAILQIREYLSKSVFE